MTATSEKVEELIDDAKAIVADGDAYGTKARHPTTIHTRQTIEKLTALLSSLNAQVEEMRKDKERLDWLELHVVECRTLLVYGSRFVFRSLPTDQGEGEPEGSSNLRLCVDEARRAALSALEAK